MRTPVLLLLIFLWLHFHTNAQEKMLSGRVLDSRNEAIASASVEVFNENNDRIATTVTNDSGYFQLIVVLQMNSIFSLHIRSIGFESKKIPFKTGETPQKTQNWPKIVLKSRSTSLPDVVVSASRSAQRLEEVTVSMSVIRPNLIENKSPTTLQSAMDQVPGVHVTEGQINIRSGSGWSYGAGIRVLLLLDDLPLISPDGNQVQWPIIPFESLHQMEIIKSASSALYGSSALNGVVNVRTRSPFTKKTWINTYAGFYDAPQREELKWWNGTQNFQGIQFSHSDFFQLKNEHEKIGFLIGGNASNDQGFQWNGGEEQLRLHWKTAYSRYFPDAKLSLETGVNGSVAHREHGQALIWAGENQAYIAQDSSVTTTRGSRFHIDPYIEMSYPSVSGEFFHSDKLQTRFLSIENIASDDVNRFDNTANSFLVQYQHQMKWRNSTFTAGLFGLWAQSRSEIYVGEHSSKNQAAFLQADIPWKKWKISLGTRYEHFRVDETDYARPVFRAGLNYALSTHQNVYASYGQGFRFPSMAELFTQTNVGAIFIYPSQNLRPELGETFELGLKQQLGNGRSFKSQMEIAFYHMQFSDMIEFTFGPWGTSGVFVQDLGFRSINIGDVSINGAEVSYAGLIDMGDLELQFLAGYTYANPRVNDADAPIIDIERNGTPYQQSYRQLSSDTTDILKYRFQHLARIDLQFVYRQRFRFGGSVRYNDFMQAIDQAFQSSISGVRQTRERLNSGDFFIDLRVGYALNEKWMVNIICDNILNREFMIRPGMLGMPRRYMMQVHYSF